MNIVNNSHTLITITKGNTELINKGMRAVNNSFSTRVNLVNPDILTYNKVTAIAPL